MKRQKYQKFKAKKHLSLLERFENYLTAGAVQESLPLTSDGVLNFHWSNWRQTCELWQNKTQEEVNTEECGGNFKKRRELFERELENYKKLPVWVKLKTGLRKTNVYELHEAFQSDGHIFGEKDALVSFHSEAGPFTGIGSMRWMDTDLYKYFVYNQILNSNMKLRQFRVGASIPILCRVSSTMINKSLMYFHQFNSTGIIFRIPGKPLLDKVMKSKYIEFYFDFTPFKEIVDISFEDGVKYLEKRLLNESKIDTVRDKFILSTQTIERYHNKTNLKRMGGDQYYIFARYCDFNLDENLEQILGSFTQKAESFFEAGLKKIA